jgi:ribosomal protein S27E
MEKVTQGTKKQEKFRATCSECGSTFEEVIGNLNVEDDRDGRFARSKCPDCHKEMFFYPIKISNSSQWGDH